MTPYVEMSRVETFESESVSFPIMITPVVRAHEKPSVMETKIPTGATPEPPKRRFVRLVRQEPVEKIENEMNEYASKKLREVEELSKSSTNHMLIPNEMNTLFNTIDEYNEKSVFKLAKKALALKEELHIRLDELKKVVDENYKKAKNKRAASVRG